MTPTEKTPAVHAPVAEKMVEHPGLGEGGKYHTKEGEHPLPEDKTLTFALAGNQNCGKMCIRDSGMAIVIICGLSYATLMTLYIVPILYDILFKKPPLNVDIGSDEDLDDIPDDAAEFIAAQSSAAQPQPEA